MELVAALNLGSVISISDIISGSTGATGVQGFPGGVGPGGRSGAFGATGPRGQTGFFGTAGKSGAMGYQGMNSHIHFYLLHELEKHFTAYQVAFKVKALKF